MFWNSLGDRQHMERVISSFFGSDRIHLSELVHSTIEVGFVRFQNGNTVERNSSVSMETCSSSQGLLCLLEGGRVCFSIDPVFRMARMDHDSGHCFSGENLDVLFFNPFLGEQTCFSHSHYLAIMSAAQTHWKAHMHSRHVHGKFTDSSVFRLSFFFSHTICPETFPRKIFLAMTTRFSRVIKQLNFETFSLFSSFFQPNFRELIGTGNSSQ